MGQRAYYREQAFTKMISKYRYKCSECGQSGEIGDEILYRNWEIKKTFVKKRKKNKKYKYTKMVKQKEVICDDCFRNHLNDFVSNDPISKEYREMMLQERIKSLF